MQARIQKWGNSLAVRIPKVLAREVHLEEDGSVELAVVDGQIVLTPLPEAPPTLAELLAGVTDANLHAEVETGPPVGREAW